MAKKNNRLYGASKSELKRIENRCAEIDEIIRKLYEDNVRGRITDERFDILSQGYETEKAELKVKSDKLRIALQADARDEENLEQFKRLVRRYTTIRAQIWNINKTTYKKVEKSSLLDVIDKILPIRDKINFSGFSITALEQNKDKINCLRNRVAHNKIILESEKDGANIKAMLNAFKNCLPESYQQGFASDINKCVGGLNIPSELQIYI